MQSYLGIYDLAGGGVQTLLKTEAHIEAPNWTPDGQSLIVNGNGLLYEIALNGANLQRIDTGRCKALNNDHGISPDGQTLVISDKTETKQSCIYLLAATGAEPRRVTPKTPSWWHGWSPDGQRLTYTAVRAGQFCIATCRLDGNDEQVLVTSPHHYDGPDYSSDGEWIWFNSDRGGDMQLWRMRTDGACLEQMTEGARDAWFPHPDPTGRYVLYLTYPPGTDGHPADQAVDLRLLNLSDSTTRILIECHGGQGSLNVPCWSPEGTRFAFMRYAPDFTVCSA